MAFRIIPRFIPNPFPAVNSITRLAASLQGPEIIQASVIGHQEIEKVVRSQLKDVRKGDPQATKRGPAFEGNLAQQVASNITSRVVVAGSQVLGGTGDIKHMDAADPLMRLRSPSDTKIRLWRILEYGVSPFSDSLKARDPSKPMVFWWRRAGILFIGKSPSFFLARAMSGPFSGQRAMIGKPPFTDAIDHPGQLGRFYWQDSRLEARKIFNTVVKAAMAGIIQRHK